MIKYAVLVFRSLLDLLDFESVIPKNNLNIDRTHLTISGPIEEADIELAKTGYKAEIIELHEYV